MKALISTNEPRESGYRVAQVVVNGDEFEVGSGLFWVDCDDTVKQDLYWYDPSDNTIKLVPIPDLPSESV